MLICMHAVNFYDNHVYHVLMCVAKLNISYIHSSQRYAIYDVCSRVLHT